VLTEVADQPGHILGDQPTDGPAGVHADYDVAIRVEHEPGGLQVDRFGLTNAPVSSATARASAPKPTGKARLSLSISATVVASSSTDRAATRIRSSSSGPEIRSWPPRRASSARATRRSAACSRAAASSRPAPSALSARTHSADSASVPPHPRVPLAIPLS
jgi:hypothetical protein